MIRGCLMFVFTLVFVSIFGLVSGYFMYSQLGKKKTVTMPALVGLPDQDAVDLIGKVGLSVKMEKSLDPEASPGTVIRQSVPALTTVKVGRTVLIIVAETPESVKVPELRGKSDIHKIVFDDLAGKLRLGNTVRTYHPTFEKRSVIATNPPAGNEVPVNSQVDLLVSFGPKPRSYVMPDLIGINEREAQVYFRDTKFVVNTKREPVEDQSRNNIIIGQNPPPESKLESGIQVELTVGMLP